MEIFHIPEDNLKIFWSEIPSGYRSIVCILQRVPSGVQSVRGIMASHQTGRLQTMGHKESDMTERLSIPPFSFFTNILNLTVDQVKLLLADRGDSERALQKKPQHFSNSVQKYMYIK